MSITIRGQEACFLLRILSFSVINLNSFPWEVIEFLYNFHKFNFSSFFPSLNLQKVIALLEQVRDGSILKEPLFRNLLIVMTHLLYQIFNRYVWNIIVFFSFWFLILRFSTLITCRLVIFLLSWDIPICSGFFETPNDMFNLFNQSLVTLDFFEEVVIEPSFLIGLVVGMFGRLSFKELD